MVFIYGEAPPDYVTSAQGREGKGGCPPGPGPPGVEGVARTTDFTHLCFILSTFTQTKQTRHVVTRVVKVWRGERW